MHEDTWVSVDGVVYPGPEARISVFDRGFLFGDSVYEVLPRLDGVMVARDEHLARLFSSAALVGMAIGVPAAQLAAELQAVADRVTGDAYLRLMVTRGVGGMGLDPVEVGPATRLCFARPLRVDAALSRGYVLHTVRVRRADTGEGLSPAAKSGSRMEAILAMGEARRAGADELLRVDPLGRVLEGGTSSFFLVRDGVLVTPPLADGILPGITRRQVLSVARGLGVEAREATIHADELGTAAEVFVTSSTRGVVPVRRVDAQDYACPGPVTARLAAAWRAAVTRGP